MPFKELNTHRKYIKEYVIVGCIVVALVMNLMRYSVIGTESFMIDFQLVYTASTAFINSNNPYNKSQLQQTWSQIPEEHKSSFNRTLQPHPFMYPPAVLLLYSPLTLIQWKYVVPLIILLHILCVVLIILLLAGIGGYKKSISSFLILILIIIAYKPIHLSFMAGQPVLLTFTACLLSLLNYKKNSRLLSVLFLTIGMIKPTVGIAFIVYYVVIKDWKYIGMATISTIAINLTSLILLPHNALFDYYSTVQNSFQKGAINDSSLTAPTFYDLTTLQGMVSNIFSSEAIGTIAIVLLILYCVWFAVTTRKYLTENPLHVIVFSSFISLFILYHRSYDLLLLLSILMVFNPLYILRTLHYWNLVWITSLLFPLTGFVIHVYSTSVFSGILPQPMYTLLCYNTQLTTLLLFMLFTVYILKARKQNILSD